jgi:branched-chain amino acid transport system permease protein
LNKKQNSLANQLERLVDSARFRVGRVYDLSSERARDLIWSFIENLGGIAARALTQTIDSLAPGENQVQGQGMILRTVRRSAGLITILAYWLICQAVASATVLGANLLGLRRGTQYSWGENILSWLPLLALAAFIPWLGVSNFTINQVTLFFSYSIILLGLNIMLNTRQASLGHAAFVLSGCYATVIFRNAFLAFPAAMLLPSVLFGGLVSSMIGLVIGFPAVRVKGNYLALVTLGLMISEPLLLKSRLLRGITGGYDGLSIDLPNAPSALAFVQPSVWMYYHAFFLFGFLFITGHVILRRTKIGRAFAAIHESEEKSSILGINVPVYKMIAFVLSAFYAGVGGGLLALQMGFINTDSIRLKDTIDYLAAVTLGGRGTLLGSALGGAFLTNSVFVTAWLSKLTQHGGQLIWGAYGVLLIFVMIVAPRGICGELRYLLHESRLKLPSRRQHRRKPFPDFDLEEELMAFKSSPWDRGKVDPKSELKEHPTERVP